MKKPLPKKKPPISQGTGTAAKNKASGSSGFSNSTENNLRHWILTGLVVLAVLVIRWRFVNMPLERDEGECAYFGHLILNGITPYTEAYNMKLPGTYYMYALIMGLFGESIRGIHIGFLLMNAGTMILLSLSLKYFFNSVTGILTAGFYGLMAMSLNVLGFAAHATHFAVFYVVLGCFFFSKYEQRKTRWFAVLAGAMYGLAFLMKQQAVYFILFGGIVFLAFELLRKPSDIRRVVWNTVSFSAGVFIPYILVLVHMAASGAFDKFWFWTVQYAGKYAAGVPWSQGKDLLSTTFAPLWNEFKYIWLLAMAGTIILMVSAFTVRQKLFALSFSIFAFLTTTPGFFFRHHYFVVFLPAGALMAAIALDYAGRFIGQQIKVNVVALIIPLSVFVVIFRAALSNSPSYYTARNGNPVSLCKAVYGTNPFVESVEIAKYLEANSSDTDKIAVLGSEPQIAFYAHRKSATGHIYTYGLMENQEYNLTMQEEMISEIEKARPLFLVFCNVPFSWLTKTESPRRIFEWYGKYSQANYNRVGLVDIPDQGPSRIYWGAEAQRDPVNLNNVWVFKRKADNKQ